MKKELIDKKLLLTVFETALNNCPTDISDVDMPRVNGAIIAGYPGIGKTTLANKNPRFVDLDSSWFKNKFEKDENGYVIKTPNKLWYYDYVDLAEHLAENGRYVFVSTHRQVVDLLCNRDLNRPVFLCYPVDNLNTIWKVKLDKRRYNDPSPKNEAAYTHVVTNYQNDILYLRSRDAVDGFPNINHIVIGTYDYDLETRLAKLGIY